MGISKESNQVCMGTQDGILKVRTLARRGDENRWSKKEIDANKHGFTMGAQDAE